MHYYTTDLKIGHLVESGSALAITASKDGISVDGSLILSPTTGEEKVVDPRRKYKDDPDVTSTSDNGMSHAIEGPENDPLMERMAETT